MNKALETVIDKVRALPDSRQRYVAEVLDRIVSATDEVYELSDEEDRLIQQSLDDGRSLASETQVRAVFDKYR